MIHRRELLAGIGAVGTAGLAGCQAAAPSTPTATSDGSPTAWTGAVVEVTDGDTMDVRLPTGDVETVRLLGVDTPETAVGRVTPEEWESIPETVAGRDWLVNRGAVATAFAERRLAGREVYIETDPESDRRGYYGRLLVYVSQSETAETSFNERLLMEGYARYYDSPFSQAAAYQAAESVAQDTNIGVWGYEESAETTGPPSESADGVVVAAIHEDAAGNDNENLGDEFVTLENAGDDAVDLGGWTVADEAAHVYEVPEGFTLAAGSQLRLYTGSGTDSSTELYWGQSRAVWNNGGDTVTLADATGSQVDVYAY